MNQAIKQYLEGYTCNANLLAPGITVLESGESVGIRKEELKGMDEEALEKQMFYIFDACVEHKNMAPDSLEASIVVLGFSTLAAHILMQKWMKERGI